MSKDYISIQRESAINRGLGDPTPAELAKCFSVHDADYRAQVLDVIAYEDGNEPIPVDSAKAFLERRSYVNMLKRTHAALTRQGR